MKPAFGALVSGTLLATLWRMKRPVVTAVLLLAVAGLAGCPIYDHENAGCYRDRDCASNYVCDQYSGDCVLPDNSVCSKPADCASTSTCTPARTCSPGDCSFHGCVAGYTCESSSGVWGCVVNGSGAAGASGEAGAGSTATVGQGGSGDQTASAGAGQGGQSVASAGAADVSPAGAAAQ